MIKMKKKIGIYKITNLVNGKVYIGQSRDLRKRLNGHKNTLNNNTHYNDYLQRSWNKYGEDNFTFEIIEYCDIDMLYERENYWITYYKSYISEYGYNATIPPKDGKLYSLSDETRIKLSNSRRIFEDEELLSYLHEYFYHYGKVPTVRELDDNELFPNSRTYNDRFGNYKEALIEAGLYDYVENKNIFERKEYTREDIYNKFKIFIGKHGRFPNASEQKQTYIYDLPTHNVVLKHYGSIENLKEELGFTEDYIKKQENQLALKQLKELYLQDGNITSRTIDSSDITDHSAKFYSERFGSLMNAYALIDIYTKEHVTEEILSFYSVHNKLPSNKDIDTYKLPPRRIISLYYTTVELKELVGINENVIKEKENIEALSQLRELYIKQGYIDQDSINQSDITKSVKFYCNRFGTLKNACVKADIPLEKLILKYVS